MDTASMLEFAMFVASLTSVVLNLALLRRGYERRMSLFEAQRNGVLLIIANHDIRQAWHRLGISVSLTCMCALFLSLPNNTDVRALLLKGFAVGIVFHVGWKSWDDRLTSRRVNDKLDAMEGAA